MEKLRPTYLLNDVKRLIREERCILTNTAIQSAHSLGFSGTEAKEFVFDLEPKDFIKSMTDNYNHKLWQDVYIKGYETIAIYIKLKIVKNAGQNLLILSFKEDETHRI